MITRAWKDRVNYLAGTGLLRQALERADFEAEAVDTIVELVLRGTTDEPISRRRRA